MTSDFRIWYPTQNSDDIGWSYPGLKHAAKSTRLYDSLPDGENREEYFTDSS